MFEIHVTQCLAAARQLAAREKEEGTRKFFQTIHVEMLGFAQAIRRLADFHNGAELSRKELRKALQTIQALSKIADNLVVGWTAAKDEPIYLWDIK